MFSINDRVIGNGQPPYLIAELSANHNGSLENALASIGAAKCAGADAIKLQTYTPKTMTIRSARPDFKIQDGLWAGTTLYDLYEKAHTPWEWHKPLFDEAYALGLDIFSTPFDESAVDFLNDLGVPAFKIASFELTDHQLISYAASKGKPLLISTGMANRFEIEEALHVARNSGAKDILLFHCISEYPAKCENYNLSLLVELRNVFGVEIGLSDHTIDNTASMIATALGASAIEKHFTLTRSDGGPDSTFSLEPEEFAQMKRDVRKAHAAMGQPKFERNETELKNRRFRRSLYFVADLQKGQTIHPHHVRRIRPGYGLAPKFYDQLIGKRAFRDIQAGEPVRPEDIEGWVEEKPLIKN